MTTAAKLAETEKVLADIHQKLELWVAEAKELGRSFESLRDDCLDQRNQNSEHPWNNEKENLVSIIPGIKYAAALLLEKGEDGYFRIRRGREMATFYGEASFIEIKKDYTGHFTMPEDENENSFFQLAPFPTESVFESIGTWQRPTKQRKETKPKQSS